MNPHVWIFPSGGGPPAEYTISFLPSGYFETLIFTIDSIPPLLSCGVQGEVWLRATSVDSWMIRHIWAKIDDGVETDVLPDSTVIIERGIWLDAKPYNIDTEYGVLKPWSDGWILNIREGGIEKQELI